MRKLRHAALPRIRANIQVAGIGGKKPARGFTLVELLVVIVVIGILAAIAIPVFLSQADKASDTALKSDLTNAAKLLQVAEANGETLPTEFAAGEVVDLGTAGSFTASETLTVTGSGENLCVEGTSDSGATYAADLAKGIRNYDCAGRLNGQGITRDGLVGWWRADDQSSITQSGGRVSQWRDLSGHGHHLSQPTAEAQPYIDTRVHSDLEVMDFRGAQWMTGGDVLDIGDGGLTVFAVAKHDTSEAGAVISKTSARGLAGRWALGRFAYGLSNLFQDSAPVNIVTVSETDTNTRLLAARIIRDSSNGRQLLVNDSILNANHTLGSTNYDTSDMFGVGAYPNYSGTFNPPYGHYLDGFIAEMMVYDRALSDSEMTNIYEYAADKWGL